jgi:hypothetical protein
MQTHVESHSWPPAICRDTAASPVPAPTPAATQSAPQQVIKRHADHRMMLSLRQQPALLSAAAIVTAAVLQR